MFDFTVAIRTYNSEKNLSEILQKLRSQTHTAHFTWEVIVVDNNSTDQTAQVVQKHQIDWQPQNPLSYFFEARQGASLARRRAMEEARGRWVAFLDDDNFPEADWLSEAYSFSQVHPNIGAFGGQIHADFQVPPPEGFREISAFFAIIERGNQEFCYNHHKQGVLPPGASIVINRKAWLESVPKDLSLLGPSQNQLSGKGEDLELLSHLQRANWEIWYNPKMHVSHRIEPHRIEKNYLLAMAWGSGLSRYHIRMLRIKTWQRPFAFFAYLLNDVFKLISFFFKNNSKLKTDVVTAFKFSLLQGILAGSCLVFKKKSIHH